MEANGETSTEEEGWWGKTCFHSWGTSYMRVVVSSSTPWQNRRNPGSVQECTHSPRKAKWPATRVTLHSRRCPPAEAALLCCAGPLPSQGRDQALLCLPSPILKYGRWQWLEVDQPGCFCPCFPPFWKVLATWQSCTVMAIRQFSKYVILLLPMSDSCFYLLWSVTLHPSSHGIWD